MTTPQDNKWWQRISSTRGPQTAVTSPGSNVSQTHERSQSIIPHREHSRGGGEIGRGALGEADDRGSPRVRIGGEVARHHRHHHQDAEADALDPDLVRQRHLPTGITRMKDQTRGEIRVVRDTCRPAPQG
jgi:hypothetical protein